MTSLRVAIGSVRRPKVEGAKAAFARLGPLWGIDRAAIEWITAEVASGVDETPAGLDHLMNGARNRARALRHWLSQAGQTAHYYVGLEGGLWGAEGSAFLQSWAYVTDGSREAFGASGAVPIPAAIAHAVLVQGRSLGEVIDVFAGKENVRSHQGAWGILTRDQVTREQSFEAALVNALAPFYNRDTYQHVIA